MPCVLPLQAEHATMQSALCQAEAAASTATQECAQLAAAIRAMFEQVGVQGQGGWGGCKSPVRQDVLPTTIRCMYVPLPHWSPV